MRSSTTGRGLRAAMAASVAQDVTGGEPLSKVKLSDRYRACRRARIGWDAPARDGARLRRAALARRLGAVLVILYAVVMVMWLAYQGR
jgi:hypothetical protein